MNSDAKKRVKELDSFRFVVPTWPVLGEVAALALAGVGRMLRMRRGA